MKKIQKKLSVVLAVMMVLCMFTALPFSASAAETDSTNKINVTSNVTDPVSYEYNANTKQVVVTYNLQAKNMILNTQSTLTYDSSVLKLTSTNTRSTVFPVFGDTIVWNKKLDGRLPFNCTSLDLYNFKQKSVYCTFTFDVIGSGNTTVDLDVQILTGTVADSYEELFEGKNIDISYINYDEERVEGATFTAEAKLVQGEEPTTEPTTEEPTTAPTTAEPTEEPTTAPVTEPTQPATEPTTVPATEPTQPVGETTLNFVVPKTASSPKCWDDGIYLAYSNKYAIDTFTKIQLTKTTDFLTPDLKTDKLTAGTYALYTVTLSKEQAEAVSKAIYVVLVNNSNTYKTYVSSKYNLLKAPTGTYSADYNTAKTSLANLNDYTFIMNGEVTTGKSIDGYGTYTGYWTKCTTVYAVAPASTKWKNCWNQGVYIGYSNDYKIGSFNKIKMTRTSTYVDVDSKTSQLVSGTYPVYTVTLTEDQVAAIDASAYVIFENASGTYRTYINGKYSVMKAPAGKEYSSEYTKTKAKLADRAKNTFVICDGISTGSSIEGYGTFTGYWSTSEVKIVESTATLYCVFPAPVKGKKAMNKGVYLAYGSSNSPADLTKIEMKKTDDKYTPSLKTNALVGGKYSVYSVTLNSDQIEAIDNAKNVVFCNSNGDFRTLLSPRYNVLNAKSGSYSATYNKGTFTTADHNGETFVVCDSKVTGSSTDGYGMFLGYWNLGEK
jgi:DNA gyrase inhibitor GyrI